MERGKNKLQDYPILINITVALVAAFIGGIIARRLKLPALVGYLLAGIIIGPFTPGFVGDQHTIRELADLGIIFLLFGVGLHFSLRDLWAVRDIALPGAILQMLFCAALGILLTQLWGWNLASGVVLGLSIAVASTVVVLRSLMDRGLLNTTTGQVAVGWLVQEDLATVLILVLLPAFSAESIQPIWQTAGLALLKTAIFAALMLFVGIRIVPWALKRIVLFRSRELFIVAVVVITLGTAIGATALFGVSLALGAFLAGVVVNESAYSHQVETEILPFRETFAVLFFVSIGMLVNPLLLVTQTVEVLSLAALIIVGKALIILVLGLFFARPARTILVLAFSLNQIGEFSFLVGQSGLALKILTQEQYQLLLMGALFSIVINPLLLLAMPAIERGLRSIPALWHRLDRHTPIPELIDEVLHDHVVIVGYGRVGRHLVEVFTRLNVSFLVVELDAGRVAELRQQDVPTLYGDAGDSEILLHAHLPTARAVVITIPDAVAAATAVATAHSVAPEVLLLARAATRDNVRQLTELGATAVIYPELEGGLALLDQALIRLGYSEQKVHQYLETVRQDSYDLTLSSPREQEALANLQPSLAAQEQPQGSE